MVEKGLGFQVLPPSRPIRFGPFEVDSRTGELRKHGIRIRLKQQALEILVMLLERPGEVVAREEIRQKLWPDDTVVEFDHSINAAVQKLRDALGESAANSRYVETLPRRGYRFIGTVESASPALVSLPARPAAPQEVNAETEVALAPASAPREQSPHRRAWPPLAFALVGVVTVLLGLLALAGWLSPWASRPPLANWTLSLGAIGWGQVSPDGSAVTYVGPRGLMLRRMDSLEETPVYAENPLLDLPTWSPDGSQLLFVSRLGLTRLPLPNGPPTILWPKMDITRGYAWAPDGTVIVATIGRREGGQLSLIPASGGNPTRLEVPSLPGGQFSYPEFLPDGKNILFAWKAREEQEVGLFLATLDRGKITRGPILLRKSMAFGHYSPSGGGKLLYVQNDRIYAQNLDIVQGTLPGEPERVVDGVFSDVANFRASFSVSRSGVLVWRAGRSGLAQLTWFDRAGTVLGTAGPLGLPNVVRPSPDEKHVLMVTAVDGINFSVVEPDKSGFTKLSGMPGALWMPDNSHILYPRREGSKVHLMERPLEGGTERELAQVPELVRLHDVSLDGKALLYQVELAIYSISLDGSHESAGTQIAEQSTEGRFSPDGHWVVYSQNSTSGSEVYVQPFPSGGLRTQLTSAGGHYVVWRGDGKEILYLNGPTIYSIPVAVNGKTIHAGPPQALFKIRLPAGLVGNSMPLAVTRDGSRILFAQGVEQPNPPVTYVMTAWDKALRR